MTDHSFDKFIKESLNNYSMPVGEEIWKKIQDKNDNKVEGAFWWKNYGFISLVGVAVIITASIILLNKNKETTTSNSKETSVTQNFNLQNPSSNPGQHPSSAEASKTVSKPSADNNKTYTKSKVENDFRGNSPAAFNISGKDYSAEIYTPKKQNKRSVASLKNNLGSNEPNNDINKTLFSNTESFSSTYKTVLLATAKQEKNLNDYATTDQLLKGLKAVNLFCSDGCPSAYEQVKNNLNLEIYVSPDYTRKTINNSAGVDEAFLKRKDSTESIRLSFSAGFRLSKTFGNNLLLKAGMQYSQINEKFSYRSENERRQTTLITIRKEILATGDTVIIRDTSMIEQIGYRVKTTYNRYRSIDIPLIASYEWGNDNLKAGVSAGVILNLYSWQKGESLDTSYVPVAFNKDGGRTFKRNIGVGVFTGFNVLKKAGESTYFFAEPYFRYNVSNITNSRSLFNQKFDVTGLNIGIRYKLNTTGQRYFNR
ncbi:MAG: outer membrane beta-barrel protein [Segetibacter sp.]|nr:outer membrane beta-barrel protein [Segetibacter sp.]